MKRVIAYSLFISCACSFFLTLTVYLLHERIEDNEYNYNKNILAQASEEKEFKEDDYQLFHWVNNRLEEVPLHFNLSCWQDSSLLYFNKRKNIFLLTICGAALWGDVHALLALDRELKVVTFFVFKHQETPGLGGEIASPAWRSKWKGLELFTVEDNLKGEERSKLTINRVVPQISGATLTSRSIERMLKNTFEQCYSWLPLLVKKWGESGEVE